MTKALNSDLDPQMTSKWPQIWYGGWNWDLVSAYQISCDSETKNIWVWFGRFCYCFDYKSGLAHPPLFVGGLVRKYFFKIMSTQNVTSLL